MDNETKKIVLEMDEEEALMFAGYLDNSELNEGKDTDFGKKAKKYADQIKTQILIQFRENNKHLYK